MIFIEGEIGRIRESRPISISPTLSRVIRIMNCGHIASAVRKLIHMLDYAYLVGIFRPLGYIVMAVGWRDLVTFQAQPHATPLYPSKVLIGTGRGSKCRAIDIYRPTC